MLKAHQRHRWLVIAMVAVFVAASCSSGSEDEAPVSASASGDGALEGSLTLFGYEDTLVPEVLGGFESANPGLTVQGAAFSTNDEAVTKLQSGFHADLINVCTDESRRMVDLGLLQPIDTSRVTDWDSIFPALREHDASVYVGDTDHDARAARAAGVHAVGVTTGLHGSDELHAAGVDVVLGSLSEFPTWFERWRLAGA